MIDGVNDTPRHAALLGDRLEGTVAHVNLIPLNYVEESSLKPSHHVAAFQRQLEKRGIPATVRRRYRRLLRPAAPESPAKPGGMRRAGDAKGDDPPWFPYGD